MPELDVTEEFETTEPKRKKEKQPKDRSDSVGIFVRCSTEEREEWDAAAEADCKLLGLGRLRTSQWLRLIANRRIQASS